MIIITNGSRTTTQGYVDQAGLKEFVDDVRSCDEVGFAKPFVQVYEGALEACREVEAGRDMTNDDHGGTGKGASRWFVAAHLWDLAAARKAG